MSHEDPPEDVAELAAWQAAANRASGYNGSLSLYVHDNHKGAPCPPHIRSRLAALRDAAAQREAGRARP